VESDKQEVWEMTFAEWVAAGAAFGIKAFFAVFVFALCCATVLGILTAIASVFGGREDDMDRR
jgi:hypothetical protein